jgi:hypothetical protein
MTIALASALPPESYDASLIDAAGGFALLAAANNNNQVALRRLAGIATFSIQGTGLGNEALAIATNLLMNLTTLGVTAPAGSMRKIRTRCWAKRAAATNAGYCEMTYCVQGAATPTVQTAVTLSSTPSFYSDIIPSNDLHQQVGISSVNSATAPTYSRAELYIEGGALCIGFANRAAADGALTSTSGARFRVEVFVDPLVILPVFV